jgi:DNA-directed RNA polymerase alpha subunit
VLDIEYVYELVEKTPRDLRMQRNFGEKSLREIQATLAALGL